MPRYEVDIVTSYYDTVEVVVPEGATAAEIEEAARKAVVFDFSSFSDAEIIETRRVRMDYDEALTDAGLA